MNKQNFKILRQTILDEPNRLIMAREIVTPEVIRPCFYDYLDGFDSTGEQIAVEPPCHTAACFAGWGAILAHPELTPTEVNNRYTVRYEAARWLDIDQNQMQALYYTTSWPKRFYDAFKTHDLRTRAYIAAQVLDFFVEIDGDVKRFV